MSENGYAKVNSFIERMKNYLKKAPVEFDDVRPHSFVPCKLFDEDDEHWDIRIEFYHLIQQKIIR